MADEKTLIEKLQDYGELVKQAVEALSKGEYTQRQQRKQPSMKKQNMADKPNVTIHITGANPQIYPSAEQIVHNHYYGDQFAEEAIKANKKEVLINQREEKKEEVPDTLFAILRDKELYEETVKWAATCTRPLDIKNRICEPLRRAGFKNFGRDFAKALIPHLTHYECSKDINNIERSFL